MGLVAETSLQPDEKTSSRLEIFQEIYFIILFTVTIYLRGLCVEICFLIEGFKIVDACMYKFVRLFMAGPVALL